MKLPPSLTIAVLVAAAACHGYAQTPEATPPPRPTPPPDPQVNKAPDFSAWTIVSQTIPGLGSQPVEVVTGSITSKVQPDSLSQITKTGAIRHQFKKFKTGEKEDIWYQRRNRLTMQSMWTIPIFEGATSAPNQPQGPDFPEVSWVSAGNFVGTQEYGKAVFNVFETKVTEGANAKEYGYEVKLAFRRAYINAETRLPWLHQAGDVLQRYVYQAAPTEALVVPPEYQAMFDNYEKRRANGAVRPMSP